MSAWNFQLAQNKSLEVQLNLFDSLSQDTIFEFNLNWQIRCDHAGPRFHLIIFRVLYFHIMIYDHRHYDYENNKWETYE